MRVKHKDVIAWMDPWPISFIKPPEAWTVRVLTVRQCLTFRAFWEHGRFTAKTALKHLRRLGRDHHVESLQRMKTPLYRPVILVYRGRIVDGNHTLLALSKARYKGKVLVFQA